MVGSQMMEELQVVAEIDSLRHTEEDLTKDLGELEEHVKDSMAASKQTKKRARKGR